MITEQEARKAAESINSNAYDQSDSGFAEWHRDIVVCAEWIAQELARREAEQVEWAKPFDAEWLESIGFFGAGMNGWSMLLDCKCGSVIELFLNHDNEVSLAQDSDIVALTSLGAITTRGQLLDLLKELKGGAT